MALDALTASGFGLVAAVVFARARRAPHVFFGAFWAFLASALAVLCAQQVLWLAGVRDVTAYWTLDILEGLLTVAAVFALTTHLAYIYTGDARSWIPVAVLCAILYAGVVYWHSATSPTGVALEGGEVVTTWASEPVGVATFVQVLLLLVELAVVSAYVVLAFHVHDRSARARMFAVSASLVLWTAFPLVEAIGLPELLTPWLTFGTGIASAGIVVAVYARPTATHM